MQLIRRPIKENWEEHMFDEVEVWLETIISDTGEIKLVGQATEMNAFIKRFALLLPTAAQNKITWHFKVMYGVEYHGGYQECDHNFNMHLSVPANKPDEEIMEILQAFKISVNHGIASLKLNKKD